MTRSLLDWYAMGGPLMHGIALCSVLVVALLLERAYALRAAATVPPRVRREMERALAVGNRSELKRLAEGQDSALVRLAARALNPEVGDEAIEAAGAYEAGRLARNLPLLSALGNLATMIGLLGTVLGMLDAFDRIAEVGSGDARVVAGGIFLALITTAAGLFAAIIAVAAHAVLSRRCDDTIGELERLVAALRESAVVRPASARFELGFERDREA
jgi:biopolymer transport protein ExbB